MTRIPEYYQIPARPQADPQAVLQAGAARFTVLGERLLRLEYAPDGRFEDRPSQIAWYRQQPLIPFEAERNQTALTIRTAAVQLTYRLGQPFSAGSLQIELPRDGLTWQYGAKTTGNLGGTARTLDTRNGAMPLEPGLINRQGWTLLDDSAGLIFNEAGWLEARQSAEGALDLYFFGYGLDYEQFLADYYRLSGAPPMLPRWALGNWWSRFWSYTQEELSQLMLDFRQHQTPLSVCIVDMDWHITETGNTSHGWTGYTWNRKLFPDPAGFVAFLHALGLKTALNLHPADGIHPHEAAYPAMAQTLGVDPATEQPVKFDLETPAFANAYFEHLHHPQETMGVDFWWMDWQQGNPTRLPGLNLLWWINHIHAFDLARDGNKRPFIFSRWGGYGNHRYPIGFSGDTVVSWESLAFQPHFTATAANVGYGWWSHDIGGHMHGVDDGELYARWVQFGLFSPILRVHSTKNILLERRPWGFDAEVFAAAGRAFRLRHAFIPYIYSMNWRDRTQAKPLVRPMYHLYPRRPEAYACPDQYAFGSELIVAPFASPRSPETRLSRQVVWLPEGEWFDFFNGWRYPAGWQAVYGDLRRIPAFARAGAILPLAPEPQWGGVALPQELNVHIFPGASNRFDLYEDDGETTAYQSGAFALTRLEWAWQADSAHFSLSPAQGQTSLLPAQRSWRLLFHAVDPQAQIEARLDGEALELGQAYDHDQRTLALTPVILSPGQRLDVNLVSPGGALQQARSGREAEAENLVRHLRVYSDTGQALLLNLAEWLAEPSLLGAYRSALSDEQLRALLEVAYGAGLHYTASSGEPRLVLWNNQTNPQVTYLLAAEYTNDWNPRRRYQQQSGAAPVFRVIQPGQELVKFPWRLKLDYAGLLSLRLRHAPGAAGLEWD